MATSVVYEGTIISWFKPRNYGFLKPDNPVPGCDVELFFHVSDIFNSKPLPKNIRVTFEIGLFGGRRKAIKVKPVDRSGVL